MVAFPQPGGSGAAIDDGAVVMVIFSILNMELADHPPPIDLSTATDQIIVPQKGESFTWKGMMYIVSSVHHDFDTKRVTIFADRTNPHRE